MSGANKIHSSNSNTMENCSRPLLSKVVAKKLRGMRNSLSITLPEKSLLEASSDWKRSMMILPPMIGSEPPNHCPIANSPRPQTRWCESWNSMTKLAERLATSTLQPSTSGPRLLHLQEPHTSMVAMIATRPELLTAIIKHHMETHTLQKGLPSHHMDIMTTWVESEAILLVESTKLKRDTS